VRADRPSSTAALIAAATVLLSRDHRYRHWVPEEAASICVRCLPAFWAFAARAPLLAWAAERATIPGLMLHFMQRKRWIEAAVRGALSRGCREMAVLGAGYDTLAARLAPEFPGVQFVEIDHPATQAVKRTAVERPNLRFVAADLGQTRLAKVLPASAAPSVFVLEGLLMYLTPAQQDALFADVRASEVVFTVMEPTAHGRIAFHNATWLERRLLALWKEPFKSAIRREALPPMLARWGLRLREVADLSADDARLARGEILVHAERAS